MFEKIFREGKKINIDDDDVDCFGGFSSLVYKDLEKKVYSGIDPYERKVVLVPILSSNERNFIVFYEKFKKKTTSVIYVEGLQNVFLGNFVLHEPSFQLMEMLSKGFYSAEVLNKLAQTSSQIEKEDYLADARKILNEYGFLCKN
jgi:hypothetical protein